MLFTAQGEKLWDTWLVEKDGIFHLFYIRIGPLAGSGPAPRLGEGWDGVSLATSTDLLHWEQHGPVLEKHPEAAWLGTGMIHVADNRYVMNFSEERPAGEQVVSFAVSDDLISWRRLPEEYDLRPDPTWYQRRPEESVDPLPRWDSLSVIPPNDDHDRYLAMICANAVGTVPGQCGTLGLLSSADGITWDAHEPVVAPGLFPSYEVPEHVQFGGRHYAIFSTNSTAAPRFDERTVHPHSGTYYVVADQAEGPYRLPPGDPMLLGQRMLGPMFGTYVGRPFRTSDGEQLLYHQWTAAYPVGWWGPPKRLLEVADFELGLAYWPGCESLKSELLMGDATPQLVALPAAGRVPVIEFAGDDNGVEVTNRGGASGVELMLSPTSPGSPLGDGRIVEAEVRVDAGRSLGLWIGHRDDEAMTVIALNAAWQTVEIGVSAYHKDSASVSFEVVEVMPWKVPRGARSSLRLMYRTQFIDVYLDDALVTSFVDRSVLDTGRLGIYAELADGRVEAIKVWAMG